ncbi:MAG TPA: CopD family protein [Caulobacteraceae bacterium]|nr:CopD family protein [Caulobacteraceae bacterium]
MRVLIAMLAAVLVLAGGPSASWAHALLVQAVPADGARLDYLPAEATLSFNEPVTPVAVRVLDASGTPVTGPDAVTVDGSVLRIELPALDTGSFVISYRVTSADGHPVAGSVVFGIGGAPTGAASPDDAEVASTALAAMAVRILHYASLLGAAGGALFLALAAGRWSAMGARLMPALCALVAAAAVTAMANVGLSGAALEGTPPSGLLSGPAWTTGLTTDGLAAAVAILGLMAVALGLALWGGGAGGVLVIGGALAAVASLAATGHVVTVPPRWLGTGLVTLHVAAAAFWLGSLVPLLIALATQPRPEAVRMVRRFSRLAVPAVALLVATGAAISVRQLGSWEGVYATPYGGLWLGKMMVVAGMLGAAAINKLRLTPALERGDCERTGNLRRSIHAEIAMGLVVLALTVMLGMTPPPRTLDDRPHGAEAIPTSGGHTASVTAQGRAARIHVSPARPGANHVMVHLSGPDGEPLAAAEARLVLSLSSAGVEPLERPLLATAPGTFTLHRLDLPIAGTWAMKLDVLVSDFEKAVFEAELPIDAHRH